MVPIQAKRFKQIRMENDLTQSSFQELLEIKGGVADIERGKIKISGKAISRLVELFSVNPLWIFGQSEQKLISTPSDTLPKVIAMESEHRENILMVNSKVAAGYPHNIQEPSWYKDLPSFSMPSEEYRHGTFRCFQVEGQSMLPNFYPNEWVICKAVEGFEKIKNNQFYVVVMHDSLLLKKIRIEKESLVLESLNKEYSMYEVEKTKV